MTSFTINGKILSAAIKPMLVLTKGNRIPVLNGIHVTVDDGAVRLTMTDLEVAIMRTLDAHTEGSATFVIGNAKLFSQCIGKGDVRVTVEDGGKVTVACGASRVSLDSLKAEDYPEVPTMPVDATFAMVQADQFVSLVEHTAYAISKEPSRFTLNGAMLKCIGVTATMVTTDGHRLAMAETGTEFGSADIGETIVPKLALETMAKVFGGTSTVYVNRDENHIWFQSATTTIMSRILAGSFPDYVRVLPKDYQYALVIERKPFLEALTRADKYADERSHAVRLTLNGACKITVQQDATEYVESVQARWDGIEDWESRFNGRYIADYLKAQTAETVCVLFAGKPMEKRNEDGEVISSENWESSAIDCYGDLGTRAIVMPMRF